MKKLFTNIINWFKSLFKKEKTPEELEQEMLAERFGKDNFDKFKDMGLFDETTTKEEEEIFLNGELSKSARKLNDYKTKEGEFHSRLVDMGVVNDIREEEGVKSLLKTEKVKDETNFVRDKIKIRKEEAKKEEAKKIKPTSSIQHGTIESGVINNKVMSEVMQAFSKVSLSEHLEQTKSMTKEEYTEHMKNQGVTFPDPMTRGDK